jgi:hypothetical protein
MSEETFVEVYEIDLEFCYLHILINFFPCGFFNYYEQGMEKSKLIVNYYNNVYQGWHEQW